MHSLVTLTTLPLYAIQFKLTVPAGGSIDNIWGAKKVSGDIYTISDYRLDEVMEIPSGTYFRQIMLWFGYIRTNNTYSHITGTVFNIGYIVSGSTKAVTVSNLNATCTPPPKDCTVTSTCEGSNEWSDGNSLFQQYFISFRNIGTSKINVVGILSIFAYLLAIL